MMTDRCLTEGTRFRAYSVRYVEPFVTVIRLDLHRKGSVTCTIGEGCIMDKDQRELANRLFATATAMLEDAHEIAVAGQSLQINASQFA